MRKIVIAIDGPAAAGKSTVAKRVAQILGFTYIDTGAMYRAVTYYCLKNGIDCEKEEMVDKIIDKIDIVLFPDHTVTLNGEDVTYDIRTTSVADNVSYIASYKNVRLFLVEQQRKIAENTSVVMDGRDIGSYVLPNADVKIFQIASVETRAKRRYLENIQKGIDCTLESVTAELKKRDYIDSHRDFAPLTKADDAVALDTSYMNIEEVVSSILEIIKQKVGDVNA